MSEQTIDLVIFLTLTALTLFNVGSLLWLGYRTYRDHLVTVRPLMVMVVLCHFSTFSLSLIFAVALSVQQWGTAADVIAIQPYLKAGFYAALGFMLLESLAVFYWRWR